MAFISETPKPPYYAVIFTSVLNQTGGTSYLTTADRMESLAKDEPGFLGIESVRSNEKGITISYWKDKDSIKRWKNNLEHQAAQSKGKEIWYKNYRVRTAYVESSYGL